MRTFARALRAAASIVLGLTLIAPTGNVVFAMLTNQALPGALSSLAPLWPIAVGVGLALGGASIVVGRAAAEGDWRRSFVGMGPADLISPRAFGFGDGPGERPRTQYRSRLLVAPTNDDPLRTTGDGAMVRALRDGQSVLVLGEPGQGKSRLALHLAHELPDLFALLPGPGYRLRSAAEARRLRGKHVLVVLDGLERLLGDSDVPLLLAAARKAARSVVVLVTLRTGALRGADQIESSPLRDVVAECKLRVYIPPLTDAEARNLQSIAGAEALTPWRSTMRQRYEFLDDASRCLHAAAFLTSTVGYEEASVAELETAAKLLCPDLDAGSVSRSLRELLHNGFLRRGSQPLHYVAAPGTGVFEIVGKPLGDGRDLVTEWVGDAVSHRDEARLTRLGMSRFSSGDWPLASKCFEFLVTWAPSRMRLELAAYCAEILGDYEGALAMADRAATYEDEQPHFLAIRGIVLWELGRRREALEYFESLAANDCDEARVWGWLGFARQWAARDLESATQAYARAVVLEPANAAWSAMYLTARTESGEDGVLEQWHAWLRIWRPHPLEPTAWLMIAKVHDRSGDLLAAERAILTAVMLQPDRNNRLEYGIILSRNGKAEEAQAEFAALVAADASDAAALYWMAGATATLHRRLGDQEVLSWLCRAWLRQQEMPASWSKGLRELFEHVGHSPADCAEIGQGVAHRPDRMATLASIVDPSIPAKYPGVRLFPEAHSDPPRVIGRQGNAHFEVGPGGAPTRD